MANKTLELIKKMAVGNTWADEEKVEDFIVGTMIFAIVLTMEKIGHSEFEPVYVR